MKLNKYSYFEALDRSDTIAEHIENSLLKHPVINKHKKLEKKVKKAIKLLDEVYMKLSHLQYNVAYKEEKKLKKLKRPHKTITTKETVKNGVVVITTENIYK